ncbi:MAG: hypothetical protein ACUVQZ_09410 [Candidatus Caldatribacteriaceae bacterium]
MLGNGESETIWLELFGRLKARSVKKVGFVVSNDLVTPRSLS